MSTLSALGKNELRQMHRHVTRIAHDSGAAEDLLQEAFVKTLEMDKSGVIVQNQNGWLYTIARRLHLNVRRSAKAQSQSRQVNEELFSPYREAQPDENYDQKVVAHDVAYALTCVQPEFAQTLRMYYWDELNTSEISQALGIPVGTVHSRLNRGKQQLGEALTEGRAPIQDAQAEVPPPVIVPARPPPKIDGTFGVRADVARAIGISETRLRCWEKQPGCPRAPYKKKGKTNWSALLANRWCEALVRWNKTYWPEGTWEDF